MRTASRIRQPRPSCEERDRVSAERYQRIARCELSRRRIVPTLAPPRKREADRAARGQLSHVPPAATTANVEALEAQAQRLMARLRARRLRARGAGGDPAGGPVPRRGRREPARAHLRVHRSRTARSCACAPTSPCRPAGCIWSGTPRGDAPARYCYSGSAFRYQPGGADRAHPREFRQAGIESFAAPDREQDDAAVLRAHRRGAARRGPRAQFSCASAISACSPRCINALPMPERWRRACKHQFWRPEAFRAELTRLTSGAAG